jgi:tetratricopeptide (TPR) repeat protein
MPKLSCIGWLKLLLFLAAAGLVALLVVAPEGGGMTRSSALDKGLERELARQARAAFVRELYAPVVDLRTAGQPQQALLKLEELARTYPGDPFALVLRAEILRELGRLDQAIGHFAQALRLNSEFLDEQGPFSRRTEIRQLVEEGLATLLPRFQTHPDNRSLATTVKEVYYLQSRLAGGCE